MSKKSTKASTLDKLEVLEQLRRRLAETLERLIAAQSSAQSGAVHSEAKQEHPKDTRSTEASYLSRGLAERVETLREAIQVLAVFRQQARRDDDPIALGDMVVAADEDDRETLYFLAPVGGGEKLIVAGREVLVLTPRAPLGAALIGNRRDGEVTVDLPGRKRSLEIRSVY